MSNTIVPGSLSAIAARDNKSLAESFLSCAALILLDESGSMATTDTVDGKSRREVARQEVIRLQRDYPGKIGLFVFSNTTVFCPTGIPMTLNAGTNLYEALAYIKTADDCGLKIIVISDGMPSQPDKCIEFARTFKNKIDVVFIGSESGYEGGRVFLQRLAEATGGQSLKSDSPGAFGEQVALLMAG